MKRPAGFTLIELLIVVAIIGILTALIVAGILFSRLKAHDNSIRNDVRSLRLLAEQVYDSQGASYLNWTEHDSIAQPLATVLADIDEQLGDSDDSGYRTVLRQTQPKDFCASAPLRGDTNRYYCIDATGVFRTAGSHCPDLGEFDDPLRCPTQ